MSIEMQICSDVLHEFKKWCMNGKGRYTGDLGHPFFLETYPFWPQAMKDAAQVKWSSLEDTLPERRLYEKDSRDTRALARSA